MSAITTHILDISRGRPAVGFQVELQVKSGKNWKKLGAGLTDANGRCTELLGDSQLEARTYRLLFNSGAYYAELYLETLFPEITIVFEVLHPEANYHVPLLISPFGYSTYRGS
ncbi:MAG TPA: hydroxyisourate hydrolase [Candidatus Dormibacteraeota bacterium]|nr:hydroxyisourate hydrolase [Candidatus Dormibacteraeota bacterium]